MKDETSATGTLVATHETSSAELPDPFSNDDETEETPPAPFLGQVDEVSITFSFTAFHSNSFTAFHSKSVDPVGVVEILGERFDVTRDAYGILVSHPRWSLTGRGDTLVEAELDLIANAKLLAEAYLEFPPSQLSPEANEMLDYLIQLMSFKRVASL
ncbi:hypothetical protein [Rhodocaloribacter sp.]